MASVTEYTVCVELVSLSNFSRDLMDQPFFIEVFMGNGRVRTSKFKDLNNAINGEFLLGKTVKIVTPLVKDIDFWIRQEKDCKFDVFSHFKLGTREICRRHFITAL